MRIIGGKNRGKRLLLPDESVTRPTTDRVRESLFNILIHHADFSITEARVLDAFAGSGALGLEAVSRGAGHVTFVENHPKIIPILQKNVQAIALPHTATVLAYSINQIAKSAQAVQLIFLDPPYHQGLELPTLELLKRQGWADTETLVCLEMHVRDDLPEVPWFHRHECRQYGQTKIILGKLQV